MGVSKCRKKDGESILIIINPKNSPAEVHAKGTIFHTVGGNATVDGDTVKLDGCTAVFLEE